MKLSGRVRRLQARHAANPALVRAWTEMLTRLYASYTSYKEMCDDRETPAPVRHVTEEEIAAEARYHAECGRPATITDWFRYLQDVGADAGEGDDDAPRHAS